MGGARAWAWHLASRRAGACREGLGTTETRTTGACICKPSGGRSKPPCWSRQNAQCSNCTAAGAGELEGSAEASAGNATWRIPRGVQISVHATVPRCAASACETVGNNTAASIAKSASQQRRRSVEGVKVNTGRIVSTGLLANDLAACNNITVNTWVGCPVKQGKAQLHSPITFFELVIKPLKAPSSQHGKNRSNTPGRHRPAGADAV